MQLQNPTGQGEETAVEFAILESKLPVCTEVPRTGILGSPHSPGPILSERCPYVQGRGGTATKPEEER
jgi:hypothetical protein